VSKVNPAGTAVVYTVYFGSGVCDAAARGIAVDSLNNAIVTGFYVQQDTAGACNVKQVYGAKINPAGNAFVYQVVWGGGQDYGNAVGLDSAGNAYFTGATHGDFPTTAGVIFPSGWLAADAFVTKVSPTGVLIYSTYLGGSLSDEGLALAVDTNGNAYVAGATSSPDFPATAGAVQTTMPNLNEAGFVTKVNSTATQVLYSTFLGGGSRERVDGMAVDGQGRIHVTGNNRLDRLPDNGERVGSHVRRGWHLQCRGCVLFEDRPVEGGRCRTDVLDSSGRRLSRLRRSHRDRQERPRLDRRAHRVAGDFPGVLATQGTFGGNYDAFVALIDPALSGAASLRFLELPGRRTL
jgi:hypothetical protein